MDSDNDPTDDPTPHYGSIDPEQQQLPVDDEVAVDGDICPPLGGTAPASRYRQHVVHTDICRVVVDILMELSKRCLEDSEFWPTYLLPITQRLTAIRDALGGALYLLRGFAPILESDDARLRDIQKAILGLVTEINTADTLAAYLAIMANGERPPMELLLARFFYLGSTSHRLQPVAEFRFPAVSDGVLRQPQRRSKDPDPAAARDRADIIALRQKHVSQNLCTALTRAAYIIPTDAIAFRPWSTSVGFSLSTWINVRPPAHGGHVSGAASQSSSVGTQSDRNEATSATATTSCDKVHLLSVGSDRMLLGIYLQAHDSSTMFFQLSSPESFPPRSELRRSNKNPNSGPLREPRFRLLDDETMERYHHRQAHNLHPSDQDRSNNAIGLNVLSSTYQAFQSTRIAMRNSLSQFNLFVSASASPLASSTGTSPAAGSKTLPNGKRDFKSLRYPLEMKGVRLQRNKWTHLAFSVMVTGNEISVSCIFYTNKPDDNNKGSLRIKF